MNDEHSFGERRPKNTTKVNYRRKVLVDTKNDVTEVGSINTFYHRVTGLKVIRNPHGAAFKHGHQTVRIAIETDETSIQLDLFLDGEEKPLL